MRKEAPDYATCLQAAEQLANDAAKTARSLPDSSADALMLSDSNKHLRWFLLPSEAKAELLGQSSLGDATAYTTSPFTPVSYPLSDEVLTGRRSAGEARHHEQEPRLRLWPCAARVMDEIEEEGWSRVSTENHIRQEKESKECNRNIIKVNDSPIEQNSSITVRNNLLENPVVDGNRFLEHEDLTKLIDVSINNVDKSREVSNNHNLNSNCPSTASCDGEDVCTKNLTETQTATQCAADIHNIVNLNINATSPISKKGEKQEETLTDSSIPQSLNVSRNSYDNENTLDVSEGLHSRVNEEAANGELQDSASVCKDMSCVIPRRHSEQKSNSAPTASAKVKWQNPPKELFTPMVEVSCLGLELFVLSLILHSPTLKLLACTMPM